MNSTHKVVVCPDSFKGSISSVLAGLAVAKGIRASKNFGRYCENAGNGKTDIICLPVADGGEGTLDALISVNGGDGFVSVCVTAPLGNKINADYGIKEALKTDSVAQDMKHGNKTVCAAKTAVIEMAGAAGLTLLQTADTDMRDPMTATTFGVGEMISDALDRGAERIMLTVGGSATNDGGCGMASALGIRFTDKNGNAFVPTGGTLEDISSIDVSGLDRRLSAGRCKIVIACDVTNPLLGKNGATYVYAPQKGADAQMLARLESGMEHYAAIVDRMCGRKISEIPGTGAGGGISVPLIAFCNAEIVSGIDAVLDIIGFDSLLDDCILVVTGEGKTDGQSACGKVISGISQRPAKRNIPVCVISGCIGEGAEALYEIGVTEMYSISEGVTVEYSMTHADELIEAKAKDMADEFFA